MTQQVDLLDIIDEEVGIELVQLLLLMGFYLQSTEKFSKCWNITGLAIRMAQNMGLQLSPADARRRSLLTVSPTQLESEMRVRVWYGCVLLDREISMSFGRPLMINSGTTDQLTLPAAIDDERLNEEAGGRWNCQPTNCPSLLESYIQTIKLYDILGQVLDREDSKDGGGGAAPGRLPPADRLPMANSDTQSLLDLDTMIMEWRDSLPAHLQYNPSSDRDRPEGALTPESSSPPCDFLAQAKRLHTRFLHVRVLILRPALEHLFQKQRQMQPSSRARSGPVARVQDLMLSDIAAQCVLTADALVRCLDTHIRSHSLVAWWYNIGSGSTLLMGRLCSFNDAVVKRDALAASWELCLQSLSRYITLSSIADKSVYLLQESARRLLPERDQHPPSLAPIPYGEPLPQPRPRTMQTDMACPRPSTLGMQYAPLPAGMVDDCQLQQSVDIFPGGGPVMAAPPMNEGLGQDMWMAGDVSGASYWPFMPFLSQLEALPKGFDMASLE
ncbi:fungal-specific transcription factor domain-containing protein [Staphylotrichum tortipilum]|uniref:Fungal-specific transcription factor domain-containing protein n=1 Tax=Staphylotrichum tortipilum TaxID=2831512 RepID=A0AAN6MBH2_9PEZI|nr:fungal-specific transcription factor domain-containing protein [Staphylotrichum longicolle]